MKGKDDRSNERKQGEKMAQQIIEGLVDAVLLSDLEGRIIEFNKAFTESFGWGREAIGKLPRDFAAERDVPRVVESIKETLKKGHVKNLECTVITKDNREVPVLISRTLIRDSQGHPTIIVSVARDITERKRAEEEMRLKDNALESSISAVAFTDLQGKLTYVNRSFLRMWGYDDKKEVLGKPAEHFWRKREDATKVAEALRDSGRWIGEVSVLRKDGSSFEVELLASVVADRVGRPISMMGSFIDITERKKAQTQAQEAAAQRARAEEAEVGRKRLEHIVDTLPDIFFVLDLNGNLKMWNKTLEKVSGYTKAEISKMNAVDLFPGRHRKEVLDGIASTIKNGYRSGGGAELDLLTKEKRTIPHVFAAAPIKDERGVTIGIAGTGRDIRRLKRAQERARLFSNAVKGAMNGIALTDLDGKHIYVNPAWEMMWGYSFEEATTMTIPQFVAKEELPRLRKEILPSIKKKGGYIGEVVVQRKDKTNFPVSFSASVVKDRRGKPIAMLGSFIDVTDRKRMEEELRRYSGHLEDLAEQRARELRKSDEVFKAIYNSSKDAIGFASLDGIILDVNNSFVKLTGYSREELLTGKRHQDITPRKFNQCEAKIIEDILRTGKSAEYRKQYIRKDGSRVPVLVAAFVVKGDKGEPLGLATIIRELTKSKKTRKEIQHGTKSLGRAREHV